MEQFLQSVRETPEEYGFGPKDDLSKLELGTPFPVALLIPERLAAADDPQRVEDFAGPVDRWWFPVLLEGEWKGIVSIVRMPKEGKWNGESFGMRRLATVLQAYRTRYPLPDYRLKLFLPPGPPEACLSIEGLGYENLTWLSVSPYAANPIEDPPPAHNVLRTLKLRGDAPLN